LVSRDDLSGHDGMKKRLEERERETSSRLGASFDALFTRLIATEGKIEKILTEIEGRMKEEEEYVHQHYQKDRVEKVREGVREGTLSSLIWGQLWDREGKDKSQGDEKMKPAEAPNHEENTKGLDDSGLEVLEGETQKPAERGLETPLDETLTTVDHVVASIDPPENHNHHEKVKTISVVEGLGSESEPNLSSLHQLQAQLQKEQADQEEYDRKLEILTAVLGTMIAVAVVSLFSLDGDV
jgi:hypothetical protein